ncbi:hypothetical protein [Actinomadura atramentaria]|uniref:hypothetical protein n=1 Tax=Actinomadura atramentaria TaxID=1990 RepID=UPI00037FDF2B|nr:hypothetical protein [Actinomadura atramentaria]
MDEMEDAQGWVTMSLINDNSVVIAQAEGTLEGSGKVIIDLPGGGRVEVRSDGSVREYGGRVRR